MKVALTLVFIFIIVSFSCSKSHDKSKGAESECRDTSGVISFSNQIMPIINASCGKNNSSCHSSASGFGDFNSYQGFISHPDDHMIHSIRQDDPNYKFMPIGAAKLTECNIAKIVNWFKQGKKNN
ncbi:MAG: hypothetical protein JWO32_574 [Bacteroidetes bacterium]|nr:hypothetical protein [Bacteroidota bacterium]